MLAVALVASPVGVSAQETEQGTASEQNVVQEPAPEEPALQLELDDAGVEVVPSPPRTAKGYTVEEMELRVKRVPSAEVGDKRALSQETLCWGRKPSVGVSHAEKKETIE